ncbi:putative 37S ribosomal protein S18, mitochondrial [Favolaschia claudopus]|uniref:37S ribosomal protein S18, mitochondrial n=1 Tax=Favolaschia claudopus TaxID=2862362 RepID=A0AAW0EB50_9AGAR
MFALRCAPRQLPAARLPFLRPPRIWAGYADEAHSMNSMLASLTAHNPDSPPPIHPQNPHSTPNPHSLEPPPAPPGAFADSETAGDFIPTKTGPFHRFHCHSTRNNTINTFTDPDGAVISWISGGSNGFKKRNRSSYEAGYQCAVKMFENIEKEAKSYEANPENFEKPFKIDLFCKGFGQGRDALFKALMTAQGDVVRNRIASVTDRTPLKIGGTRSRKRKRR